MCVCMRAHLCVYICVYVCVPFDHHHARGREAMEAIEDVIACDLDFDSGSGRRPMVMLSDNNNDSSDAPSVDG